MIEYSGHIRCAWEGVHESYIQEVKRELNVMRHTVDFLVTILRKLLHTSVFSFVNKDNPFNNVDNFTRTYDLRIYPGTSYHDPQSISNTSPIVVGMMDADDNLYVCVDRGVQVGIVMYAVHFDDNDGYIRFNLWYSKMIIGNAALAVSDRKELMNMSKDFFMFLHPMQNPDSSVGTIICKSWRVRDQYGQIRLPQPQRHILTTLDNGE